MRESSAEWARRGALEADAHVARAGLMPGGRELALAQAVALAGKRAHVTVVQQAVEDRGGDRLVRQELGSALEGNAGRNDRAAALRPGESTIARLLLRWACNSEGAAAA